MFRFESVRSAGSHALRALAVAVIAMAAGLFAPVPRAAASTAVRNPEDLLIVDCLLPGQVRKLGANSMFMSARKSEAKRS